MKKKKSKASKLEERRKADALALAQLIYDIYRDKKRAERLSSYDQECPHKEPRSKTI